MKAAIYENYGGPEVVKLADRPRPEPENGEILVKVYATSVTTADWRFRASVFPTSMWLFGRLMAGLFRPRNQVLGMEFSGRVVAVGEGVTRFRMGDEVFGFAMGGGAHAEYLTVAEDAAVTHKPANISYEEAAATPFGAQAALAFLRDFAKVQAGEKVLVSGASGGVGVFAVQIARHFGADVTGIASAGKADLVRDLGASDIIDYTREDYGKARDRFDVILDPVGKTTFGKGRRLLNKGGRHVFIEFGLVQILQALWTSMFGSKKVVIGISEDSREDIEIIADLLESGEIRPVIDTVYPLEEISKAHAHVESRHKTGSVVVRVEEEARLAKAA